MKKKEFYRLGLALSGEKEQAKRIAKLLKFLQDQDMLYEMAKHDTFWHVLKVMPEVKPGAEYFDLLFDYNLM